MTDTRPPFQGDSLGNVFPGLKPMGYSVFALRAMQNVQTPGRAYEISGLKQRDLTPEIDPTVLGESSTCDILKLQFLQMFCGRGRELVPLRS